MRTPIPQVQHKPAAKHWEARGGEEKGGSEEFVILMSFQSKSNNLSLWMLMKQAHKSG